MRGNVLRSKAKWVDEGEKPSQYFCNLENRNFINKIIPKIDRGDGKFITNQAEILSEVDKFYTNLYSSHSENISENWSEDLKNYNISKLSEEQSNSLNGELKYQETLSYLKKMKNNKSSGTDGYTTEFYKIFWIDLGHFVIRSLNYGYACGELSITQKRGVINCIPNGDKPKQYLKNWCPISLFNTSYKIVSGCIAERMKTVLDKLIHPDQTGFIKGRYIGDSVRLIYDIMKYVKD